MPHRLFLAEITAGHVRHCGFVLTGHWASQYGKWFRATKVVEKRGCHAVNG
jgi:hypothetical protein